LEKIHCSILDSKLPTEHYDLAILSHLLYYIDKSDWLETIKIAYKAIKPEGYLVITLSGEELGKAELIKYFGGYPVEIDNLTKQCISLFGSENVWVFSSEERVITTDLSSMLHIGGFFLYDARVVANKNILRDYIENHCHQADNTHLITTQQRFIAIKKSLK
jgi:predicted SAM-dependent methyltransferase